jgi:hypothetical protein
VFPIQAFISTAAEIRERPLVSKGATQKSCVERFESQKVNEVEVKV